MNLLLAYVGSPRFRKAMRSKPGQKGFSLIELIIAVAVIAILSAAVLPQFANQSLKAANATAKDIIGNAVKECGAKMANNNSAGSAETTNVIVSSGSAGAMVKGYTISGSSCGSDFSAVTTTTGLKSYCYKHQTDDSFQYSEAASGSC